MFSKKQQTPVVFQVNRDSDVITSLKGYKIYDLFHQQAAKFDEPRGRVMMEHHDPQNGRIIWYCLFKNHPRPEDNGYTMTILANADKLESEMIEAIRQAIIDSGRTGPVMMLSVSLEPVTT